MENQKTSKLKSIGQILLIILSFFLFVTIAEIIVLPLYSVYILSNSNFETALKTINQMLKSSDIGFINYLSIVQNIVTITVVLLFTMGKLKEKLINLKLLTNNKKSVQLFCKGIICGFSGIIFITLIGTITGITKFQSLGSATFLNWLYIFILSLITFLFVGFGEEFFFRGYIFNKLLESGNKLWAIFLSSFIFIVEFHFIETSSGRAKINFSFYLAARAL